MHAHMGCRLESRHRLKPYEDGKYASDGCRGGENGGSCGAGEGNDMACDMARAGGGAG